ncbi:DNA polymerase III subunit delta [Candidatus Peregrinibacteria bacterium]|jgi:DNA polymerase III subunit delta|nr:DNA polymerase III subunit delta [Candidatus Peregrinibacteria bacterium]MBT7736628.1 DNA polymerase III subunit delta [Candidatus Peregrinibacteria bacterium]
MAEEQNNKKTVFLFHGEDKYSSNEKLLRWKNEFMKKYGEESNIEVMDGKSIAPKDFISNIETLPFLCEKRLIIVKDIFKSKKTDNQKLIAEALDKTPDFCIVVFHENDSADKRTSLYKKIGKIGTVDEFKNLKPQEITNWILNRAKKDNINIDFKTANYLTEHCGNELWRVSKELEKLHHYAEDKQINSTMIEEFVTPALSSSVFKLTDCISSKKVDESLKVLQTLKNSGEELTMVFFMIVRHFRILIQVFDMISKGEHSNSITKRLKQHPFVIQKTTQQSRNFTLENLEKIYQELLQIDKKFKTGVIRIYQQDDREFQLAIEKFIINCCK